jgi:AhpC/TSA family
MYRLRVAVAVGFLGLAGCMTQDEMRDGEPDEVVLGPVDGRDLPGVDLDRVQVGQSAPDFTLASLAGPPVTLSAFRGSKNVVLVFYRGHW